MSMISSSGGRNRSFCRSSRGLDIVRLHLGKPRPENHEPAKTGIPKRKKAGLDTRLSCKTDYFITADQLDVSAASGFFTGDFVPGGRVARSSVSRLEWSIPRPSQSSVPAPKPRCHWCWREETRVGRSEEHTPELQSL